MRVGALEQEIKRNLELVTDTVKMIEEQRDMLQGDVQQRIDLHKMHTDIWDTLVQCGDSELLERADTLAPCYQRLNELNELIDKFNADGDTMVHSPLLNRHGKSYGRSNVLNVIREQCATAEDYLHTAYREIEQLKEQQTAQESP